MELADVVEEAAIMSTKNTLPSSVNVLSPLSRFPQFTVPETFDHMIVHHPHRLHEGVADRAAHKLEPSSLQVLAHGIRFRGFGRDFLSTSGCFALARGQRIPKCTRQTCRFRLARPGMISHFGWQPRF